MSRTFVKDFASGRTFCIEVIHGRNDRKDGDWTNGGIDPVKNRGSIALEDSTITPENGFKNIELLPPGVNAVDRINEILNRG